MTVTPQEYLKLKKRREWKLFISIIIIIVLIVALIKGCQNNRLQLGQVNQLIEKHNTDSVKMFNDSVDFANRIQFAEGKIELNYDQYISSQDSLRSAEARINNLLARHKPIKINTDTSVTLTPNEFLQDCQSCFFELEHGKELVKHYENRVDSLKATLQIKSKIQEQRIKQLNEEKGKLNALFNDCIAAANDQKKRYEPRRKVFLTFTGLTQFHLYTIGAGAGLLYMDKRERIFGGNAYATNNGGLYTVSISFPLSFKRIK